jgi:hypothetical protein
METQQILDELAIITIKEEALQFVKDNVTTDPGQNWEVIYNLKMQLLTSLESAKQMREDYKKQIERSEKRNKEIIEQLKKQIK